MSDAFDPHHNGWCVICLRPLGEELVPEQLPDGCVAHNACWLRADYSEVAMHKRPVEAVEEPS